jgi:hypothetical protein
MKRYLLIGAVVAALVLCASCDAIGNLFADAIVGTWNLTSSTSGGVTYTLSAMGLTSTLIAKSDNTATITDTIAATSTTSTMTQTVSGTWSKSGNTYTVTFPATTNTPAWTITGSITDSKLTASTTVSSTTVSYVFEKE